MSVTVEEFISAPVPVGATNYPLTTTLVATDVVLVVTHTSATRSVTVTGLGTPTQWPNRTQVQPGGGVTFVATMTGVTGTGTVTLATAINAADAFIMVVRGLTVPSVQLLDANYNGGQGTGVQMPLGTPAGVPAGQLLVSVYATLVTTSTITMPSAATYPSTGWTVGTTATEAAAGNQQVYAVYHIGDSDTSLRLAYASSGTATNALGFGIMLGEPAPNAAVVLGDYVEALTVGTPTAAVDAEYAEVLTYGTPQVALDSAYVELLTRVDSSTHVFAQYAEVLTRVPLPPITEVSVVEVAEGTNGSTGTAPTVSITTSPLPGDLVVVTVSGSTSGRTVTGVTGLPGATWSHVATYNGVGSASTHVVWKAEGATTPGTITVTLSGSMNGSVRAFLIRGLTDSTAVTDMVETSSASALPGPTMTAGKGQAVVTMGYAGTKTGNLLQATAPATGWQIQTGPSAPTGYHHTGYRVPTESPTAHSVTLDAGSTAGRRITTAVFGTAIPDTAFVGWGIPMLLVVPPVTYASVVLADSPLGYWRMGEADNTTRLDSSGNGRDATASGVVWQNATGLIDGDSDKATSLPGAGYVEPANTSAWDTASITLEAWIKPTAATGTQYMIIDRDPDGGSSFRVFQFRLESDGGVGFIFWTSAGIKVMATPASAVTVGGTFHVVATYDSATGAAVIYVNGTSRATATHSGAIISGTMGPRIGAHGGTPVMNKFEGVIDEAAIYGTALSATRIAAHYAAGI